MPLSVLEGGGAQPRAAHDDAGAASVASRESPLYEYADASQSRLANPVYQVLESGSAAAGGGADYRNRTADGGGAGAAVGGTFNTMNSTFSAFSGTGASNMSMSQYVVLVSSRQFRPHFAGIPPRSSSRTKLRPPPGDVGRSLAV